MINLSAEQAIFYIVFSPFVLIILLMAYLKTKSALSVVKKRIEHNKRYKAMMKEVDEMKARGEFHEWIKVPFTDTENVYVCKKTGYCPSKGGFFDMMYVSSFLEKIKEKENYEAFKSEQLSKIAAQFDLKLEEISSLTDEIIDIPNRYVDEKRKDVKNNQ